MPYSASNQPPQQITQNVSGDFSATTGSGGIATVNVNQSPLTPTAATTPAPPRYFTGRRQQLDALKAILRQGHTVGVIALQGMGGIGKTATVQQLALEVREEFPGGTFWGSLPDHDGNPRPILRAWSRACAQDLTNELDPNALANLVRNLLTARRKEQGPLLVIIDDVRMEWLDAAQLLQRIVPTGVPLLLTTRDEALAASLSATAYRLDELTPGEALVLLKAHAGAAIVEAEPEVAEKLLHMIGYLPLAIELAGKLLALKARKPGYKLATLQQAVAERVTEALTLPGNLGLATTFAISYEAQSPEAQRVYRWLGVFTAGPIHLASIAGVLRHRQEEIEAVLDMLVTSALLTWGETVETYTLHPLLQQYAQTLLAETGETDEARQHHLAYYLTYAQANAQIELASHYRLEAALPNLLMAIGTAVQLNDHQAVSDFALALYARNPFFIIRGYVRDSLDLLRRAVGASREMEEHRVEGIHLGNLGIAYHNLGEVKQAIEYYQESLAISRETGDRRGEGNRLGNLALAYSDLGQLEKAIEYYNQALLIARETDDRHNEGAWLGNLALAYSDLGQIRQAILYGQQALAISREVDQRQDESNSLGNLGNSYYRLGLLDRAVDYYAQALQVSREIGDRRAESADLGNLGNIYSDLGQMERAIVQYEQALSIAREIGDRRAEGVHLGNLGSAYSDLGQLMQAIEYYEQALKISQLIGDQQGEGIRLANLGLAYSDLKHPEKARQYLTKALKVFEEIKSPFVERVQQVLSDLK